MWMAVAAAFGRRGSGMPRGIAKSALPTKVCPVCRRPFAWRKKWEKVWAHVVYCSERCQRSAKTVSASKQV